MSPVPMRAETLEKLIWVLLYGGAALLMLGLWTLPGSGRLGHGLVAVGVLLALVGVFLVWVRSRAPVSDPAEKEPQ